MKKNIFNKEEQNLFAWGGPYGMPYGMPMPYTAPMGALGYSLASDNIAAKKAKEQSKQKFNTNINAGIPKFAYGGLMNDNPTLFTEAPKNIKAIGGVVQTNSSRFRYKVGQVLDVTKEEAERLKAMGYEYRVIG